ncbi:hypothetical protein BHE74_00030499 [Ensete ventricosum]|nr:hypothetical protein BHE74_00030499 [Ensete ventricosum]RZS12264.1 hypothetical protein BHM03_00043686 [Ensete ventricosum]
MEVLQSTRCYLDNEVLKLARDAEALQSELQSTSAKAIVDYKVSRGFKLRLERIEHITYEFGYQVALEGFWAKYPDLFIDKDPFADQPEDANVQIESSQPFDDSVPPED